jgi:hypothetical protein
VVFWFIYHYVRPLWLQKIEIFPSAMPAFGGTTHAQVWCDVGFHP